MGLYREEKRREEGGRTEVARRIKGGVKRKETDQPIISSLSVLHRLEHTEIHRVGREEKEEGRDRGHLVEKKESPKEERVVKPVTSLSS